MPLPTETDVSRALTHLAATDGPVGVLRARVKGLEYQRKVIYGLAFLDATGTVGEREATAYASSTYRAFVEDYENAVAECETMAAKRKRAELTIEVWRSLNANQRRGNI